MRVVPIAFLVMFGMLGCKDVHSGDLAGSWILADTSRRVLPAELQKAEAKLVLDANGTFAASELPGLLYSPPGRPELDSGRGECRSFRTTRDKRYDWTLTQSVQDLRLRFRLRRI